MTSIEPSDFRDHVADTTRQIGPRRARVLAKRAAPLRSQGDELGALEVLLSLAWRGDGAVEGALAFRWHQAAAGHSVVRKLEAWRETSPVEGVEVESKPVSMTVDGGAGRQLKVTFTGAEVPRRLDPLLELAGRLGCLQAAQDGIRAELARVKTAAAAGTRRPEGQAPEQPRTEAAAEPEPAVPFGREERMNEPPQAEREPRSEEPPARSEPEPSGEASAPPRRELGPEEQERADTIEHNAEFDPARHPKVLVNEEITNSDGVTFRLVMKRRGGKQKRMWTRVSSVALERAR